MRRRGAFGTKGPKHPDPASHRRTRTGAQDGVRINYVESDRFGDHLRAVRPSTEEMYWARRRCALRHERAAEWLQAWRDLGRAPGHSTPTPRAGRVSGDV